MGTGAAFEPAVLLIGFNRPRALAGALERIRDARPRRLYVALDGPRSSADVPRCRAVREIVEGARRRLDLRLDAAAANLGLRARVESALDWVFDAEERAVIVEDDCWPTPDFFRFSSALLDRFAHDERVGSVCGSTAVSRTRQGSRCRYDYHFSQVGLPWGWGTWRRAWRDYDRELAAWPQLRESGWLESQVGETAARQWRTMLDHADAYSSWWVRWLFTGWAQGRWAAVPRVNLVENVGGDEDATHTRPGSRYADLLGLPVGRLGTPLRHPSHLCRDQDLDRLTLEALLPWSRTKRRVRQLALEGLSSLRVRWR
jgi:hypothetical protein